MRKRFDGCSRRAEIKGYAKPYEDKFGESEVRPGAPAILEGFATFFVRGTGLTSRLLLVYRDGPRNPHGAETSVPKRNGPKGLAGHHPRFSTSSTREAAPCPSSLVPVQSRPTGFAYSGKEPRGRPPTLGRPNTLGTFPESRAGGQAEIWGWVRIWKD